MSAAEPVSIRILDRDFLIACTAEERPALMDAAHYLDGKMREMRDKARTATLDRIAVLTALNISHELLAERRRESSDATQLAEKLQALNAKLEHAFAGSLQ